MAKKPPAKGKAKPPALTLEGLAAQLAALTAALSAQGTPPEPLRAEVRVPKGRRGKAVDDDDLPEVGSYVDTYVDGRAAPREELMVIPGRRKHPKKLPPLDELTAAREEAAHHKEGSRKLQLACDELRLGLENVVSAEVEQKTGRLVQPEELRQLAREALDRYSRISGQSWKRHKVIRSWAGGTGNPPVWLPGARG